MGPICPLHLYLTVSPTQINTGNGNMHEPWSPSWCQRYGCFLGWGNYNDDPLQRQPVIVDPLFSPLKGNLSLKANPTLYFSWQQNTYSDHVYEIYRNRSDQVILTQWNPCGTCIRVDPEGQPWEHHNEQRGGINTHHVEPNLSPQGEDDLYASVVACRKEANILKCQ